MFYILLDQNENIKNATIAPVGQEDVQKSQDKQKQKHEAEECEEAASEDENKAEDLKHENTEVQNGDGANKTQDTAELTSNKFFVHSQWLAVQSTYFKALFFSGMKETFSKEVVMKIYKHELQAHSTLIEAMYELDVLSGKDYRLVLKVLALAHKYDVRHVIKKCKYVLLSTTASLEMCEYILKETTHLDDMAEIYDMIEMFLVKEFTPIDKTWTMDKFTELSETALKLLLGSDNLATKSENTIFVALMKWVEWNVPEQVRNKCELLAVVRFEFMSADFLYDKVKDHPEGREMSRFNEYLLKGLAYHGFSESRRNQLKTKPKKRPFPLQDDPTFSWVIDDKLQKKLSDSPGYSALSNEFWCQGYEMQLRLSYAEDPSKCSFHLVIPNLKGEACLNVSYRVRSILFGSRDFQSLVKTYTVDQFSWGYRSKECNNRFVLKNGYTIDVWVEII